MDLMALLSRGGKSPVESAFSETWIVARRALEDLRPRNRARWSRDSGAAADMSSQSGAAVCDSTSLVTSKT